MKDITIAPEQAEEFGMHYAYCKEMAKSGTAKCDLYGSAVALCDQFMWGIVDPARLDTIGAELKSSDAVASLHRIVSSHLHDNRELFVNVRLDSQHREVFRHACESALKLTPVRSAAPGRAGLATAGLA